MKRCWFCFVFNGFSIGMDLLLVLLLISSAIVSNGARIFMDDCDINGFLCDNHEHGEKIVTYDCGVSGENDVELWVFNFRAVFDSFQLKVQNCEKLQLELGCPTSNIVITKLEINNVTNLVFIPHTIPHHIPEIILENIGDLEKLPAKVFSNSSKEKCQIEDNPFEKITFKNVNIGTIENGSFDGVLTLINFTMIDVKIKLIEGNGLRLDTENGDISIINSTIQNTELNSFNFYGNSVEISGTTFSGAIVTEAFNITCKSFLFINNNVNHMENFALVLDSSRTVNLRGNKFERLGTQALEGITFSNVKDNVTPEFDFTRNFIKKADRGCLHPDINIIENCTAFFQIRENEFACSCQNLEWLVTESNVSEPNLKKFYDKIVDPAMENACVTKNCKLRIEVLAKLKEDCSEEQIDGMCLHPESTLMPFNGSSKFGGALVGFVYLFVFFYDLM